MMNGKYRLVEKLHAQCSGGVWRWYLFSRYFFRFVVDFIVSVTIQPTRGILPPGYFNTSSFCMHSYVLRPDAPGALRKENGTGGYSLQGGPFLFFGAILRRGIGAGASQTPPAASLPCLCLFPPRFRIAAHRRLWVCLGVWTTIFPSLPRVSYPGVATV